MFGEGFKDFIEMYGGQAIMISSDWNRGIDISNIEKALEHIQERQTNQAAVKQQYIMTATNNLALMLDEIVQQMQQQMSQLRLRVPPKAPP